MCRLPASLSKFIILSFSILFLSGSAVPAFSAATLSIGISTGDDRASFSAGNAQITITSTSGAKATFKSSVQVVLSGSGAIKAGSSTLNLPVTVRSSSMLRWNNRPYRGYFRLVPEGRGFNVVNVLGVEDYLKGVLKMEVNPAWPMESLKAQAIIARTYALRNKNRHGSSGFDLCALNHCQVYRGVNAEDPTLTKAIESTRGMVLNYNGAYAATFYHSDSGGHTANVSAVWGSSIPYLQGKPEPVNYESPYSKWQVTLRMSDIQRALSSKGINVGKLSGLQVASTDSAGRAVDLTLLGSSGRTSIRASQFRMIMGSDRIRSTYFTIGGSQPAAPTYLSRSDPAASAYSGEENIPLSGKDEQLLLSLTQKGVFKTEELMDMLVRPEKRGFYLRKAMERQSGSEEVLNIQLSGSMVSGETVTFIGKGWGHGVGLSQWGAKSLAEAGWDHKRILQHYFPGTSIDRVSY